MEMTASLQKREEQSLQNRMRGIIKRQYQALFKNNNSPVIGNKNAKVQIVEFFDYQCHHCKVASKTMNEILANNKDIRVVFKEFPIFGKPSLLAAKAALAAAKQGKYYAMHNALMANTQRPLTETVIERTAKNIGLDSKRLRNDMNSSSIHSQIRDNRALARIMGFSYTPVFIITNAKGDRSKTYFLPGAAPKATLMARINSARG